MCSPCRTMSSPTLTMAVTSDGGTTSTSPRRKRAAPTPPARAVITAREARPPQSELAADTSGFRCICRRLATGLASGAVPIRVAVDATPLLGARTGLGRFVEGALGALAGRPEIDLRAYGLTWRGRAELGAQLPAGVAVCRTPMVAGPLLRAW